MKSSQHVCCAGQDKLAAAAASWSSKLWRLTCRYGNFRGGELIQVDAVCYEGWFGQRQGWSVGREAWHSADV
jgi:hypothetical protein